MRRNEHWKRILVGSYVDLVKGLEGLCRRDQCSPMGVKRVACRETSVERCHLWLREEDEEVNSMNIGIGDGVIMVEPLLFQI